MDRNLSSEDFRRFLDALDPVREQAAEKYLALRERLERFFEWRLCENSEELADTVFDRVARKIKAGEKIKNAEAFAVTVAKFVLLENRREAARLVELEENSPNVSAADGRRSVEATENEFSPEQFECLEKCLAKMPAERRRLLVEYFDTDEKTLIPARRRLAKKIGVNLNSLRIRICRLKAKTEKCVKKCCREKEALAARKNLPPQEKNHLPTGKNLSPPGKADFPRAS